MLSQPPTGRGVRAGGLAAAFVLLASSAQAHDGALDPRLLDWHWIALDWTWDPWVVGSLASVTAWYRFGVRRSTGADGANSVATPQAQWSFAAGMAWLVVALVSPLDAAAGVLFSAHMVQHLILLLVAAPPLARSRLPVVLLWAFAPGTRKAMARGWLARPGWRRAVRLADHPMAVWALSGAVLIFWHLPGPYGWAMSNQAVHTLEHAAFLLTGYGFWSVVLEPARSRRLDYGMSILFVATVAMQGGLLGAILTFSARPLYPAHAETAPALGLTALEDQQLAGLIMWVPASLFYLAAIVVLFQAWLGTADRHADAHALR